MVIKSKKQLKCAIKADYIINRGKYDDSIKDVIKRLIIPDHIMSYLVAMRKTSYYKYRGGIFPVILVLL